MKLAHIFRCPIKGLGSDALNEVALSLNEALPGDRVWAVTHGHTEFDPAAPAWVRRRNFQVVANSPALAQVTTTQTDETIICAHPQSDPITVDLTQPDDQSAFLAWIAALPTVRPGPYHLAHVPGQALTDHPDPLISLHSTASLHALSEALGVAPDMHRFRGNLWIDDAPAWAEPEWIGKTIKVGDAVLQAVEPIERCAAPEANPQNGTRDAKVVGKLYELTGTADFGVLAKVITPGPIRLGDTITVET